MLLKDLENLPIHINKNEIEVDPTHVIEHAFFEKRSCSDYRNASIDFFIKNKVDFHSTCNSAFDIFKRFIKIKCPTCSRNMETSNGGGSGNHHSMTYKCPHCQTEACLTIPSEGFNVKFKEQE